MIIKTRIEALDHQGRGLTHHDGKVVFVPNALPGELVEIKIIDDKKNYAVAKVVKYLEKVSERVEPNCPYYAKCGGCHLSHFSSESQINYKKETLTNVIKKYAEIEIEAEVITGQKDYGYRNKITLKIENYVWGYYALGAHKLVKINECLIAKGAINKILEQRALFKIKNGEIVIRVNYNDEIMISITTKDEVHIETESLTKNSKIVGIIVNDKIYYGEDNFMEIINKIIYQVNYQAFFQVNSAILEKVFELLNNKRYGHVLDLYCGVGTLGLAVKKEKLYGIEISASAIKNALFNSKMNKQNNLYILGDSAKIKELDAKIDTVIIDPPRGGIDKTTIDHLMAMKAEEIIYMSCNPLTLARDLNILKTQYQLEKVYLLDMFPQTYHMETLVILANKTKNY